MALFFTVLLGISSSILGFFIIEFNQSSLIREVELGFDADIAAVQDWREYAPFMSLTTIIDKMERNHPDTYFSLQNPAGDYVYGALHPEQASISMMHDDIALMEIDASSVRSSSFKGMHHFAVKVHTFPSGARLLVARDVQDALKARSRMQLLGLLTILLMLVVICTSFFISTYVVSRVNTIWRTAKTIVETGDLSRRLEPSSEWDDLSSLSNVLNELLERAENLMGSVRQVSDNIAHDLRTPLARLRGRMEDLDLHLKKTGCLQGQDLLVSLIAEADKILRTFNALLRIARIESGKVEQQFAVVELRELLEDVLELYEPLAEDKNIRIKTLLSQSTIMGDSDMLFQVFANLIDNAVKFTPENGEIYVVIQDGDDICVCVEDTGIGISEEDRTRVFDRFYRAEKSRSSPGSGLGLSLASAVMNLHKGKISAEPAEVGTRFLVHLPKHEQ